VQKYWFLFVDISAEIKWYIDYNCQPEHIHKHWHLQ